MMKKSVNIFITSAMFVSLDYPQKFHIYTKLPGRVGQDPGKNSSHVGMDLDPAHPDPAT